MPPPHPIKCTPDRSLLALMLFEGSFSMLKLDSVYVLHNLFVCCSSCLLLWFYLAIYVYVCPMLN